MERFLNDFIALWLVVWGAVLLLFPHLGLPSERLIRAACGASKERIAAALARRRPVMMNFTRLAGAAMIAWTTACYLLGFSWLLMLTGFMNIVGIIVVADTLVGRMGHRPRAAQLTQRSATEFFAVQLWAGPVFAIVGVAIVTNFGSSRDIIFAALISCDAVALTLLSVIILVLRRGYEVVDPAADAYVDRVLRVQSAAILIAAATAVPLWAHGTWPLDTLRGWIGFLLILFAIFWTLFWLARVRRFPVPEELQTAIASNA